MLSSWSWMWLSLQTSHLVVHVCMDVDLLESRNNREELLLRLLRMIGARRRARLSAHVVDAGYGNRAGASADMLFVFHSHTLAVSPCPLMNLPHFLLEPEILYEVAHVQISCASARVMRICSHLHCAMYRMEACRSNESDRVSPRKVSNYESDAGSAARRASGLGELFKAES